MTRSVARYLSGLVLAACIVGDNVSRSACSWPADSAGQYNQVPVAEAGILGSVGEFIDQVIAGILDAWDELVSQRWSRSTFLAVAGPLILLGIILVRKGVR